MPGNHCQAWIDYKTNLGKGFVKRELIASFTKDIKFKDTSNNMWGRRETVIFTISCSNDKVEDNKKIYCGGVIQIKTTMSGGVIGGTGGMTSGG